MKQLKLLTCGLLASIVFAAAAPHCHADYVVDEGASMITAESPLIDEYFPGYTRMTYATASLDSTITGVSRYTSKGGQNSGAGSATLTSAPIVAAVTAQYYWAGGGVGLPYTFRFLPTYAGSASATSGGKGKYTVSLQMDGSFTGTQREPSPNSPQDDWDIGNGDIHFSIESSDVINGPTGNFGTAESDLRSYPCIGTSSFSVTNKFTSSGSVRATSPGATASLDEIIAFYKDITIDN